METGKQTWSATLYDSRHDYVARYGAALLEWLSPQPGEAILDLGCGTGDLSVRIAQAGAEVWGVDADPVMLAQARAKFPGLRFIQADAMALPDLGRASDAEQEALFAETAERLRPTHLRPDGWHADYTRQRLLCTRL